MGGCDDVRMAERPGRLDVVIDGIAVADRVGELADLLAADLVYVRVGGYTRPTNDSSSAMADDSSGCGLLLTLNDSGRRVPRRQPKPRPDEPDGARTDGRRDVAGDADQRVSRCSVCLPQLGQNFCIANRSGSLRRFFLVM